MAESCHPILDSVKRLLPAGSQALVALSGGADSVALLVAMVVAGVGCHAVHCNFHLRGAESDRDEAHARGVCARLGVEITVVQCDVEGYRRDHPGVSVEMACRDLRYDAFREIGCRLGIDKVAVAHHAEDNVETLLLNLFRGSGLKGLTGMAPERGDIVRPLLRNTRAEIVDFLASRGFDFVTDSSNLSCDYRRNAVRNAIMPTVLRYFPSAERGIEASMSALSAQKALLEDFLTEKRVKYVVDEVIAAADIVRDERHPAELLFELLNYPDYRGYTADTVGNIAASVSRSGLVFSGTDGSSYRLEYGMLRPVHATMAMEQVINDLSEAFDTVIIGRDEFRPERNPDVIYFDADRIGGARPFTLRSPRRGDRIAPFGMKGTRLLSDIFTDMHLPRAEREAVRVLSDGAGRILWVVGIRASRHYAVTPDSRFILRVTL